MANDIIDIDVFQTVENVEITVEPNLTTVNITDVVIDTTKLAILNNLSDLNNVSTARTNLGLGTLATQNGNFADKYNASNPSNFQTISEVESRVVDHISNIAYDATVWDGVTDDAPSMNSVRDKFVSVDALKANLASPTFTGSIVVPNGSASTEAVNKGQLDAVSLNSALVPLNEGAGVGYVINGRNAANFGGVGLNAIDLSTSTGASSTRGATGTRSFVIGENNTASSGEAVVLGGNSNTASGINSTILGGNSNTASGQQSTIIGVSNTASATNAVAIGSSNNASAVRSFLQGIAHLTPSFGEVVMGEFSSQVTPSSTTTAVSTDRQFTLGNGTSTVLRSNALVILKNGLATLPSVTNALITAGGAKAIITKEYADANYSGGGGGGGSTNLSTTYAPTTVTVVSSSGADAEIKAVDNTDAGIVTVAQKSTWDGKQDALGFTPYNATNPSGYQTSGQVTTAINSKINSDPYSSSWMSDQNGTTKDVLFAQFEFLQEQLYNKQPLSAVLTATTASFTTADETKLDGIATGANVGVVPNTAITGATKTKITYDVKGLVTAGADATQDDILDGSTNRSFTNTEKTKLTGIATGATANSSDATLLARANHTGTQLSSTISDIQTTITNNTAVLANTAKVSFDSTSSNKLAKYPSTATNGKILQGNGTNYVEVDLPSGAATSGSGTVPSGNITWGTTAPTTVLNNTYEWEEDNNVVTLRINLSYSTSATNQSVTIALPSDAPTPKDIAGFTSALDIVTFGSGMIYNVISSLPGSAGRYCLLRRNTANTGYEIVVTHGSAISVRTATLTIQYFK